MKYPLLQLFGVVVLLPLFNLLRPEAATPVSLQTRIDIPDPLPQVESTLETIGIEAFDREVVMTSREHIEAPNWAPDGKTLICNSNGLLYGIPVEGGSPTRIPTGFANNDQYNNQLQENS